MAQEPLIEQLLDGNVRALAKLISTVEDRADGYRDVVDAVYAETSSSYRIGITGPPGAGKSTLVNGLAQRLRQDGSTVGILASDPTSPFSGGALLGDRVRMHDLAGDPGVFIRSLATRGGLGGLSRVTHEVSLLLEAAGYETLLYETVGVGQAEIDVVRAADSVGVVLTPQSGDAVQALKAGLMEIADLFVVNKSDQEGADRAAQALQVALRHAEGGWTTPIVKTVASKGEGLERLQNVLAKHRESMGEDGLRQRRKNRLTTMIQAAVEDALRQELWNDDGQRRLDDACERVSSGEQGPFAAAQALRAELDRVR